MNAIAAAYGPKFIEGVKRYRRKYIIETSFFLYHRRESVYPCPIPPNSDTERAIFPLLETGRLGDMVDATYALGILTSEELGALRSTCERHAPDLVDIIDALAWIARAEYAEDPRARVKAIWRLKHNSGIVLADDAQ